MTFLNVPDTVVCGRTCRTWLQVAYHRTPTKSTGATFVLLSDQSHTSAETLIASFIRSPFKRHFNKCEMRGHHDLLDQLCVAMNEMTELTSSWGLEHFLSRGDVSGSLSLLLQYHRSSLHRLTLINVNLNPSHLRIFSQLSSLITLEVLVASPSGVESVMWDLDQLQALFSPDHQLAHLRDFRFRSGRPLSSDHLQCFKNAPLEAFTFFSSFCMTRDFLESLGDFKYLTNLNFCNQTQAAFEPMCQAFSQLFMLNTLTLGLPALHFQRGQLHRLLQHQTHLTSLTFETVEFESPECLSELGLSLHRLTDLTFQDCGTVRFEHLLALRSLQALERLIHKGMENLTLITHQEQKQLQPPSLLLPTLKVFTYDWKDWPD